MDSLEEAYYDVMNCSNLTLDLDMPQGGLVSIVSCSYNVIALRVWYKDLLVPC